VKNTFVESFETEWKQKEIPVLTVMMTDNNNIVRRTGMQPYASVDV